MRLQAQRNLRSNQHRCPTSKLRPSPVSLSPLCKLLTAPTLPFLADCRERLGIFVPAGLSGTGSIALQFAKHVYRAAKVISTVSTSKLPKIRQLLGEDTVDQIVDYTKEDVLKKVEKGSVDFLYDTVGTGMAHLPLMKPKSGIIVSVSNLPSGRVTARVFPRTPWILKRIFDAVDFWNRKRAGRWSVK